MSDDLEHPTLIFNLLKGHGKVFSNDDSLFPNGATPASLKQTNRALKSYVSHSGPNPRSSTPVVRYAMISRPPTTWNTSAGNGSVSQIDVIPVR